jgi:hypothetical protein
MIWLKFAYWVLTAHLILICALALGGVVAAAIWVFLWLAVRCGL